MSMRSLAFLAAGLALAIPMTSAAQRGPGLGKPASAATVAAADLSIAPNGAGLPPGSGTVARGAEVYGQKCQSCHGASGAGGSFDRLTGGIGTLAGADRIKTVASFWPHATTLFDYVRRAMPPQAPQSLSDEEVYAVVAYLLSIDGIVPKDAVMDARTLPQVRMPNREGFVRRDPQP